MACPAAGKLLILWSDLPKAVQALPAALAAVAAGLVGIVRWPHNKTRFSFTAEALKSEHVKWRGERARATGGSPGDPVEPRVPPLSEPTT